MATLLTPVRAGITPRPPAPRPLLRHSHVFDPSYRGSHHMARCVTCGGRRTAPQHKETR